MFSERGDREETSVWKLIRRHILLLISKVHFLFIIMKFFFQLFIIHITFYIIFFSNFFEHENYYNEMFSCWKKFEAGFAEHVLNSSIDYNKPQSAFQNQFHCAWVFLLTQHWSLMHIVLLYSTLFDLLPVLSTFLCWQIETYTHFSISCFCFPRGFLQSSPYKNDLLKTAVINFCHMPQPSLSYVCLTFDHGWVHCKTYLKIRIYFNMVYRVP